MPYKRKTLTELREENRLFMQSELKAVGALLRYSNLRVVADMDAGMSHLHYAFLDYMAQQSNPFTATDEWLASWMALKQTWRKAATPARSSSVEARGTPDVILPAGSVLNRGDGYQYKTDAELKIGPVGTGSASVTAILPAITDDITGGGYAGNAVAGTLLTLDANVAGIERTLTLTVAASSGANIESEEAFRSRGLLAYQNPPQGGSDTDYKKWALDVAGITRAWVKRRIQGAGTVGIYIMCDGEDTSNNGFPVGTDGVSTLEEWGTLKASGDQGRVADHVYPLQTDTAIVYVCSPIAKIINVEISGIINADSATVASIKSALNDLFFTEGSPTGNARIPLSDINKALSNLAGTKGYILTQPHQDIVMSTGEIPVLGSVVFV